MYIKVINPNKHGKTAFGNTGSCQKMVNYLNKENENKPVQEQELFFNNNKDNISSLEVIHSIDYNRKGLAKDRAKFHSLVIAPDEHEQKHIKNNPEYLKLYTKQVMEIYARNFYYNDRILTSNDLVWYAKFERERKGKAENNMHIHIIVSARDRTQTLSLSPNTNDKNKFNRVNFAIKSEESFDRIFQYKRGLSRLKVHQIKRYGTMEQKENLQFIINRQRKPVLENKPHISNTLTTHINTKPLFFGTIKDNNDELFRKKKKKKKPINKMQSNENDLSM